MLRDSDLLHVLTKHSDNFQRFSHDDFVWLHYRSILELVLTYQQRV